MNTFAQPIEFQSISHPALREVDQRLNAHASLRPIDIKTTPPDIDFLREFPIEACLRCGVMPWRRIGERKLILAPSPEHAHAALAAFQEISGQLIFLPARAEDIAKAYQALCAKDLTDYAHNCCAHADSVRSLSAIGQRLSVVVIIALLTIALSFQPIVALATIYIAIALLVLGNSLIRMVALLQKRRPPQQQLPALSLTDDQLPAISVLIPLYKEANVLRTLLSHIYALDYPHDKLDVKLLIEYDDDETQLALAELDLPEFLDVINIPEDKLKTKPKAMNYALPFCTGEIIGIYDAEDRPEPGQLRAVVSCFESSDARLGAVQCQLDFFNTHHNWMTRCFTIEYQTWFHGLLPAVEALGFAVPLGGTSVFVRKTVLEAVGAWDAHNVTEDADLGIRLKRRGYQTKVIDVKTWEEANARPISWIRQRSRWLKGYFLTWLNHMRNPAKLIAELGPRAFIGFQIMFLGAISHYLSIPLMLALWASAIGIELIPTHEFPMGFHYVFWTIMVVAQATSLSLSYVVLRSHSPKGKLFRWVFTLPLYWPLGTMAAIKAMIETLFIPFYWDKTAHGIATKSTHL